MIDDDEDDEGTIIGKFGMGKNELTTKAANFKAI